MAETKQSDIDVTGILAAALLEADRRKQEAEQDDVPDSVKTQRSHVWATVV